MSDDVRPVGGCVAVERKARTRRTPRPTALGGQPAVCRSALDFVSSDHRADVGWICARKVRAIRSQI